MKKTVCPVDRTAVQRPLRSDKPLFLPGIEGQVTWMLSDQEKKTLAAHQRRNRRAARTS